MLYQALYEIIKRTVTNQQLTRGQRNFTPGYCLRCRAALLSIDAYFLPSRSLLSLNIRNQTEHRMSSLSKQKQILGLVGWLIVSFAASAIGAVASIHAKSFYSQLAQPNWAPPPAIFGPVWMVLYALMGIAVWLVWRSAGFRFNRHALILFLLQLAFNALWSWIFFAWHLGAMAFAEILVLWIFIVATLVSFWRVRTLAGLLLIPYLLWVTFASVLNYSLWQLNPQVLG